MPRPTTSLSSKIADGRTSPASPRWGSVHGSGGNQGSLGTTSKRGATPVSSPRAYASPGGSNTRGSAGSDDRRPRSTVTGPSERISSGSNGKGRKSLEVDNAGGREDAGEGSGRIRVAVRVRPFSEKEKLAGKRCVISMAGNQTRILDPAYFDSEDGASSPDDRSVWERTFSFDHSFWSHSSAYTKDGRATGEGGGSFSSQADVHQALGNFLLDNACRGYNCSLFAYGQTGSGKTYTMLGDSSDLTSAAGEGTAGLIPRICVELFQRFGVTSGDQGGGGGDAAKKFRGNGQASLKVSFCEIYNEQVRDLFGHGGSGHGLRVREHPTKGAFVEGLSARPVSCYQQVQRLLEDGMSARATAATAMNEVSSRSHAIFTIHITVTTTTKLSRGGKDDSLALDGEAEDDISSRTSKICLVDLAGSERANATGAKGDRLREAANINKSLSTLGDVIKALAKRADSGRGSGGGGLGGSSSSESFIPYRNSMLTWLLKDSIGGNSKTVMLAAISPVAEAYQETMSTLRYVERAKEIVNSVAINDANANPLIGKLREEIRALQELLEVREATIAEHEGNMVMLSAALERARAGDDDKVLRALADADDLEAALLAEKRERGRIEAAAVKEAEAQERKHARELREEADRHAADLEECLQRHEGEISRVREEAAQMLAFEVGLAKDQAAEERATLRAEFEQKVEIERVAVAEAHAQEMAAAVERHRAEGDRALEEATSAAASAADAAAAEVAELLEKHAVEMADSAAEAEAAKSEELRRLREDLEREMEEERQEMREARRLEEAKRDAERQESTATAKAYAEAAQEAALKELREQHDTAFVRERDAHAIDLKAAVEEAVERLNAEHEHAMAAAETAREEAIKEARIDEATRFEKESAVKHEVMISILRATREEELDALGSAHLKALEEVRQDADGQLEALREDSARSARAAEESHREQLASARSESDAELRRAVGAEREKAEAALAAAIEALKAETEVARTAEGKKHRDDVRAVGEQMKAEIKVVVAKTEKREKEVLAEVRAERAKIESAHQAQLLRLGEEHAAVIAALEAAHEGRLRKETSSAAASAESRRKAEVEAAELRAAERFAAYEAQATANLAAEQKRRDEISQKEEQTRAEIVQLQARAASALATVGGRREEHEAELAELRRAHNEALEEARDDGEARLANAQAESEREVKAVKESLQGQVVSARKEHEKELRSAMEAERAKAKSELAAAMEALKAEQEAGLIRQEKKHREETEEARRRLSLSMAEARREHETAIEALGARHRAALAASEATCRDEIELAVGGAKDELASAKAEAAAVTSSQDARHQEEMLRAQGRYEDEISRSKAEVDELRRELAQGEDKIKEISETVERKLAEDRERLADLKASQQAELARLRDEHAAAAAEAERRRTSELAEATRRYESSADSMRKEMTEEKATFVSTHLLEMRKVKAGGAAEVQRVLREAEERSTAQEAKAASEINEAKLAHLRDLQAAAASAEAARKVELAAANDAADKATSELEAEIRRLEELHQEKLRKMSAKREAEDSARSTAASELHAKAIADLTEAHEKTLRETIQAERSSHAAALSAVETREAAVKEAAALAVEQGRQREEALRETLDSEHRLGMDNLETVHRTALEELRIAGRKVVEELERKVEAAQAAAEDAQASADELTTRANALDEMLKASVGSNELELAGHRSRVAQLQGFVARREAASSLSPSSPTAGEDKNSQSTGLSPGATRSLQQRVMDLRAIAAAVGCSAGGSTGSVETGLAEFASSGMVEGLTVEKYAEELEVVLVRATVDAAAARQDHLEADMQCQGITRQLVGLKLVHAQLRECLEDTQVKLEHKSQSAARRLLNSAARLAYEFAKPDRASSRTSVSPKSTRPKAMSRQNSGARSPLSRTRGGALRRKKTPEPGRDGEDVETAQVAVDFSATL